MFNLILSYFHMHSNSGFVTFHHLYCTCLLGFCKMTFTIYLIFTSIAVIIFSPLFTTFCSFYVFCYYLSRKNHFFMLSTWYYTWFFKKCFLWKNSFHINHNFIFSMNLLKLKIIGMLWHLIFLKFLKLKIGFNIFHINCLLGFRKMTFTIYLIFTLLAGVIFRPLFSTRFCTRYFMNFSH